MLINRSGTMAVPFMSMYITQSLRRSVADAGLIITLFGAGSVLGTMASGYFIDKAGFRAVQVFTSLAGGLLFIAFGHISNFTALCIMTVVLSFVADAFRPANMAAVSAYSTPQNLTRSYTLNRLALNLGWALGSSLGGILAAINYHLLFWVEGSVYILVGVLILLLLPARPNTPGTPQPAQVAAGSGSPWKDPFLLRFLALVTIYSSCFIIMFRLVPVYWKTSQHINESVIGILMALNGVIIALFEMVLVRRWEAGRPAMFYIIMGMAITGLGYALLVVPVMWPVLTAIGAVLLLTLGEMMAFPFINTMIMSRANEHNRGKYAAAYALAWSVAQIAGPGGGALLVEEWSFVLLWIVLAAVCVACAVALRGIGGAAR